MRLGIILICFLPYLLTKKLSKEENKDVQHSCGKAGRGSVSNKRILNGMTVDDVQFSQEAPWLVSLKYNSEVVCSGALLSPRHVLTAAHCLEKNKTEKLKCGEDYKHTIVWKKDNPANWSVRVGSVVSQFEDEHFEKGEQIAVKKISYPASFSFTKCPSWKNQLEDIAIMELEHDVTSSPRVSWVCLPKHKKSSGSVEHFGYGLSKAYRDNGKDDRRLRKQELSFGNNCMSARTKTAVVCLRGGNTLGCGGDSGSSAFIEQRGRFYTIGVYSAGQSCDAAIEDYDQKTGVYQLDIEKDESFTDVVSYIDWICKVSGVCNAKADRHRDRRPTYTLSADEVDYDY